MKYRVFLTLLVALLVGTLLFLPKDLKAAEPITFDLSHGMLVVDKVRY